MKTHAVYTRDDHCKHSETRECSECFVAAIHMFHPDMLRDRKKDRVELIETFTVYFEVESK